MRKVFIPKFTTKYPTTCAKFSSLVNELEKIDNELIKPTRDQRKEITRKFFAEKGKLIPNSLIFHFCEACYSSLLAQVKPYSFDEIELTRIENKFQPKKEQSNQLTKEISETDLKDLEKEIGQWKNYQEKFILELIKELNDKTMTERERESKIAKLKSEIQQLEQIANRTPQEERELQDKKKELAELERHQSQDPKKTNWTPWIIGGIVLVVVIAMVIYLLKRNKNKGNHR